MTVIDTNCDMGEGFGVYAQLTLREDRLMKVKRVVPNAIAPARRYRTAPATAAATSGSKLPVD